MANKLTKAQKKEWAQILFTKENMLQKEIAVKVGVTEKTITNWKEKYGWEKMRKSILVTKEEQVQRLYDILDKLTAMVEEDEKLGNSKTADMIVKYTAAIKTLETETSVAEIIDVGRKFINFLRKEDLKQAQDVTKLFDAFIQSQL